MIQNITLAVSGSISAYKAADLTSQLKKLGYSVQILMTEAASHFITPLTLQVLSQKPVLIDIMAESDPKQVSHIEVAKQTDLFIVVPASANTIAKLAYGLTDNMVTGVALALPNHVPKLIAPAMNTKMYDNPITQNNLNLLKTYGYQVIPPREALLACGDLGRGALADLDTILEHIKETAHASKIL